MRIRFYIFLPTLIILSLIGFVGESSNSKPNVRYHKETEWIKTNNSTDKDSKCFFYNFYLDVTSDYLDVKPWSNEYILLFNRKVRVKLISQLKIYRKRDPMILKMNKSYIPRKSIETTHLS